MDRRFLAILGVIAAIFIGIAVISQSGKDETGNGPSGAQPTSHITGEGKKQVTLLEYGDFQCPVCQAYYGPIKEVAEKYSADIYFQFRHLPLVSIHPNAFAAARAAEAAGMQGKFWEMHSMLYEPTNWQSWTNSSNPRSLFDAYAKQLELDEEKFKQDFASNAANDAINADLAEFDKTGRPSATPSFFLNGRPLDNAELSEGNVPSVDKISKLIEAEIAKQN